MFIIYAVYLPEKRGDFKLQEGYARIWSAHLICSNGLQSEMNSKSEESLAKMFVRIKF